MDNITSATAKYEIILAFISEQINTLKKEVDEIQKGITVLDETNDNVKRINQNRLMKALPNEIPIIETDIKFNEYIYSLQFREKILAISLRKSEIERREMYFRRCIRYIQYITALNNKNEIAINQSFYSFTNYLSQELISNYRLKKDFLLEKKDIHDSYLNLLKIYTNLDEERKEKINKKLMSDEEYNELVNKINKLDKDIFKYKNKFKDEKPNITQEIIDKEVCLNFEVFEIADAIYKQKKEKKK